jgi:hypothetical protein
MLVGVMWLGWFLLFWVVCVCFLFSSSCVRLLSTSTSRGFGGWLRFVVCVRFTLQVDCAMCSSQRRKCRADP